MIFLISASSLASSRKHRCANFGSLPDSTTPRICH
jgi:hypothetical protein